jgi:protein-S-isoprenylcysteine O-methyltransferase Ste14
MKKPPKILPPIWLLLTIGLMVLAHRYLPLITIPGSVPDLAGFALLAVGLIMILWSALGFGRAGTNVVPFREATALVTTGFYRISRNPMYLGMVLILAGGAFKLGSLGAFLPIPLFVLVIRSRFILGEEQFLEGIFGAEYLAYKNKVRRWL